MKTKWFQHAIVTHPYRCPANEKRLLRQTVLSFSLHFILFFSRATLSIEQESPEIFVQKFSLDAFNPAPPDKIAGIGK
jgi:hypothetical protein